MAMTDVSSAPSPRPMRARTHSRAPFSMMNQAVPVAQPADYMKIHGLVIPQIDDVHGRFIIREFMVEDHSRLREINGDLFFAPLRHLYGPLGFLNAARKQQKQGSARRDFYLAIADKVTGELIGSVMLYDYKKETGQAEIAYFVDPTYQNIQIATDAAVRMLLRLGKHFEINSLKATTHPDNKYSRQLLARLGFRTVGAEFVSRYKADPADKNNYTKDGLKFDLRQEHVADYARFLSRWPTIESKPDKMEKMAEARERRESLKQQRFGSMYARFAR